MPWRRRARRGAELVDDPARCFRPRSATRRPGAFLFPSAKRRPTMGLPLESPEVAARTALRLRAAHPGAMLRISELINGVAARGLMLPRVPEQIARHFREFVVVTDAEDHLLGCAALRVYTPQLAELVALAVAPEAQGRGVGRM